MGKLPEVWPSGQRQQTVNLSGKALRWFESIHLHHFLPSRVRGSNSGVESQPSKLLVAGSNPVSRSTPRGAPAWCGRRDSACIARCERCGLTNPLCVLGSRGAPAWSGRRDSACIARCERCGLTNPLCVLGSRGAPAWSGRRDSACIARCERCGLTIPVSLVLTSLHRRVSVRRPSGRLPPEAVRERRRPKAGTMLPTQQPPPPSPPPRPATTGTPAPSHQPR